MNYIFISTFVQTCCPIVPKREFKPVPYINVRTKEFATFEYYTLEKLIIVDNSEVSRRLLSGNEMYQFLYM